MILRSLLSSSLLAFFFLLFVHGNNYHDNNQKSQTEASTKTKVSSSLRQRQQQQQQHKNQVVVASGKGRKQQEDDNECVKKYEILSSEEIYNKLVELSEKYSMFVQLTTSQERYGLPKAGDSDDCPFDPDKQDGCNNYILTIQDYVSHPVESKSSNYLPEVLWSGALHGNERIGPTSVIEATELLLEASSCESLPNKRSIMKIEEEFVGNDGVEDNEETSQQQQQQKQQLIQNHYDEAIQCREILKKKGINNKHRQWLSRLVSTRRIIVVPTGNALGYYRNKRKENNIDPNRDFPYDYLPKDSGQCMQSICGRTFNELFREHMVQLSLTFHAGMEVISYEWGAPSWVGHFSPDHYAQKFIAKSYREYASGWQIVHKYNTGVGNDVVYYVRGGFEDWAYSAFTPEKVIQCTPTTFGGYDAEKTTYNNSTLRAFNMLVETSNSISPLSSQLGTSHDVLYKDTDSNGHVSRNIRLALLAVELVEPYVSIISVQNANTSSSSGNNNDADKSKRQMLMLSDDVVPNWHVQDEENQCDSVKTVVVPNNIKELIINWTVGGSLDINKTIILYGKWADVLEYSTSHNGTDINLDCLSEPLFFGDEATNSVMKIGVPITNMYGKGYFSDDGPQPAGSSSISNTSSTNSDHNELVLGPIFSAKIDVSDYESNDKIIVLARARVDQSWKDQPENIAPKVPPQSHIVNARTDPNWRHESSGKVIQGRLDRYTTIPLTLIIGEYDSNEEGLIESSNRFGTAASSASSNGDGIDEGY